MRPLYSTLKAPNYGARAGQTIVGQLGRAADGKFTNAGGASAAKPKAPKGKRTPKQTPEQRAEATAARQQESSRAKREEQAKNRAAVANEIGLPANTLEALDEFASPDEQISLSPANAAALEERGLVDRGPDGKHRMTGAGRAVLNAAERGDIRAAADSLSRGGERQGNQRERDRKRQEAADKRTAREQERAKPKEPKPAKGGGGGGGKPKPEKPKPAAKPAPQLIDRSEQRQQQAGARQAATIRRNVAQRARAARIAAERARKLEEQRLAKGKEASFSVFKDASGRYRWLLNSSNAYEDRDHEIVSTHALARAVQLGDATEKRGPLRWWHVPGAEIGDCDFQAVSGRHLLESGTFRSEALGAAVARKAHDLRASIGFHHPATEPDAAGVFHMISIFERSLVPVGRAANEWTRLLVTKELPMLTEEKKAALKALLGDEALINSVLDGLSQTDKEATEKGVRFKGDDEIATRLAALEEAFKAANPFAAKPKDEEEAAAEEVVTETKIGEELAAEAEVEAMSPDDVTLSDGDFAAIERIMVEKIGPMLNTETKVLGYLNEMKGMFTGGQAKKDAEAAEQQAALASLKAQHDATSAQLAALLGEQPRSSPHRITDNPTVSAERMKELGVPTPDPADPFADITKQFLASFS